MAMIDTIYGLSNEDYHFKEPYREYLSSSALKHYLKSPKAAKFAIDNPVEEKSEALLFGSLFHDLMANIANVNGMWTRGYDAWRAGLARFDPPINPKTGVYYGANTKAYAEAYTQFEEDNKGKTIVEAKTVVLASDMTYAIFNCCGSTSVQVRKLLKWGKPEVSHFIEYEGCKFKYRPDLETRRKIVDWKTVSTDDLSEENINRIILKFGYHVSAAFYQFFEHERTGLWKTFYLVLVSKVVPYDAVMVDMANYGYRYLPEYDMVVPGPGAIEFKKLLDLHIKCTKENEWPGAEAFIPSDNGVRVIDIQPPRYYSNKFLELE